MWFSDIFSRHICFTVAETIAVTTMQQIFGSKNVKKTTLEAAEMILGPSNQQKIESRFQERQTLTTLG